MTKMMAPSVCFRPGSIFTAISTARRPKSVVNLITGFSETDDVSLNGSPTVSPTTVAACRSVPFFLQVHLDELLRVVPCTTSVRHEERLIETKQGNRDEVADEIERLHARK